MASPIDKKFMDQMNERICKRKGCFGFLKGRKVKKESEETIYYSPIFRSEGVLNLNIYLNRKNATYS